MKYDTSKLKPFDLEKAKAGDPVCTRDGSSVRILCFDIKNMEHNTSHISQPIIALVDFGEAEYAYRYYSNGKYDLEFDSPYDLMMNPKTVTKWLKLYKSKTHGFFYVESILYEDENEIEFAPYPGISIKIDQGDEYIRNVKIEFEV